MAAPDQSPEIEAIAEKVLAIMVESFDFPEAEARQRLTLWKASQHDLAGQALAVLLPGMSPAEQDAALLQWALEGLFLERDLRAGAAQLGIDLVEPEERPPRS
jgi:hypothetical protein